MIIEFTGAPCCGKSTIAHELAEMLRKDGHRVYEKLYILSHSSSRMKRIAVKGFYVGKHIVAHPLKALSVIKSTRFTWWLNYFFVLSCIDEKGVHILEQGLCQCIASLFDGKNADIKSVDAFFSLFLPHKKNRVQVFVYASADNICERVKKRKDNPYYANTINIRSAVENSISITSLLQDRWEAKYGKGSCIMVNNNKDKVAKEIASTLYESIMFERLL